jgi:hypothetical protein
MRRSTALPICRLRQWMDDTLFDLTSMKLRKGSVVADCVHSASFWQGSKGVISFWPEFNVLVFSVH